MYFFVFQVDDDVFMFFDILGCVFEVVECLEYGLCGSIGFIESDPPVRELFLF